MVIDKKWQNIVLLRRFLLSI